MSVISNQRLEISTICGLTKKTRGFNIPIVSNTVSTLQTTELKLII